MRKGKGLQKFRTDNLLSNIPGDIAKGRICVISPLGTILIMSSFSVFLLKLLKSLSRLQLRTLTNR